MSLQVWLPLQGDLHNQGLSNINITNSNATINNNGKIGKCYNFNNATDRIVFNLSGLNNIQKFSICCWIKPTSWEKAYSTPAIFANYGNWNNSIGFSTYDSSLSSSIGFIVSDGTQSQVVYLNKSLLPINTWSHITGTFDGRYLRFYLNGILVNTKDCGSSFTIVFPSTGYIGGWVNTTSSYGYLGYINDFRLYDHALSPKEVEEIAKGLVLWYQLNGENQVLVPSGYQQLEYLESTGTQSINTGIVPTDTHKFNFKYALMECNSYKGPFGSYGSGESDKCTRIICARDSSTNVIVYFTSQPSGGTSGSSANVNITTAAGEIVEGYLAKTGYLLHNLTTDITQSSNTAFADSGAANNATMRLFGINASYSKTRIYYFDTYNNGSCVQKLIPAKRLSDNVLGMYDVITKTFFTNIGTGTFTAGPNTSITGTVYDSSGYSHNGTVRGSLTAAAGSPRYNVATTFPTESDYFSLPHLVDSTAMNNEFTFSCWLYRDYTDATTRYFYYGLCQIYLYTDFKPRISWRHASADLSYDSTNIWAAGPVIAAQTWTHLVFTFKNGVLYCYVNGVQYGPSDRSDNGQFIHGTQGSPNASLGYSWIGKISDIRTYATALTEAQVKELYNTSMSIDSNGNVYARELVEL